MASSAIIPEQVDLRVAAFVSSITEPMEGTTWWNCNEGGVTSRGRHITGIRTDGRGHGEHLGDTTMIVRLASTDVNKPSAFNNRVDMVVKTYQHCQPIGVIVHRDHPGLKDMGIQAPTGEMYVILGYFLMTDFWINWNHGTRYIMAKLEKFNQVSTLNDGNIISTPNEGFEDPNEKTCDSCKEALVVRYKDCPAICGFPMCPTTEESTSFDAHATGTYHEKYIDARVDLSAVSPASNPLLPDPPMQMSKEEIVNRFRTCQERTERINWKGWMCDICSRLNLRLHWNRLECRNCGRCLPFGMPDFSFQELVSPEWRNFAVDAIIPGLVFGNHIRHSIDDNHHSFVLHTFRLDDENAVILGVPKEPAITSEGGFKSVFDQLWSDVQDGKIPIRRCSANASKISGQLTRFFATNYGEEYLAKMKTQTAPFGEAPEVIRTIRDILTRSVSEILQQTPEFNEMLCIGNYPNMGMGWHRDGETGVGPIVASMSFGGTAIMKFAMTNECLVGKGGTGGKFNFDTILPGCMEEEKKRALAAKRDSGEITVPVYREKFKKLVNKIKAPYERKAIVQFRLPGTGALMIQVGASLNQRYEHTVENHGIARLVCTCRSIDQKEESAERPAKRAKRTKQANTN